jgi:hypothetical protein
MNLEILLTTEELEYLERLAAHDESLMALFEVRARPRGRPPVLASHDQASRLRKYFGDRLAQFG